MKGKRKSKGVLDRQYGLFEYGNVLGFLFVALQNFMNNEICLYSVYFRERKVYDKRIWETYKIIFITLAFFFHFMKKI